MAQQETIVSGMAGRYASALFALAAEQNATDKVAADLTAFDALVRDNADMQRLVRSPVIAADDQVKALDAVLAKVGISGLAANFIKLVAAKRRLFAVDNMIAGFHALNDAARGVTRAEVTVASAMSDTQVQALKQALAEVSGGKSVEVAMKIDPSIIGGLIVKLGSRMVDGSLKTKLNSIRTRMKEVG